MDILGDFGFVGGDDEAANRYQDNQQTINGVVAPLAWVIRRRQQRARELRRWKRDDASGLILPDYKKVA